MNILSEHMLEDRVAAAYEDFKTVKQAKAVLRARLGVGDKDIRIVSPNEARTGAKLEGESQKLGKSMLSMHLYYPAIGLVVGSILATLLVLAGPSYTQDNPVFTFIALISPSIFIGAFYAGLLSLKPSHDKLNQDAIAAKKDNHWVLIVDAKNSRHDKQEIADEIKQTDYTDISV